MTESRLSLAGTVSKRAIEANIKTNIEMNIRLDMKVEY